ncbi:MAG: EAL domain-containing protein [Pseudomonadota bacterium]
MPGDIRDSFKAGALIFAEGEDGDCAYIIEKGRVEISIKRGDERIVLAERGVGEIFGEMAIVDDQPRTASVTAVDDCQCLILSRAQLQARLRSLDPVLRMVFGVVLDRFRDSLSNMRGAGRGADEPQDSADPGGADQGLAEEGLAEKGAADQGVGEDASAPPAPDPSSSVFREVIERIELEQELVQALDDDALKLFLQPLVCANTERVMGFEALARWPHPERGMISPGVFVAMAEEADLMRDLTRWAVRSACRILAQTPASGAGYISVNVTAGDISDPAFFELVREQLELNRVGPERLVLEITESSLIEQPESAVAMMKQFGDLGVMASIDDFGAGYSNFSYLARYPVATVKMDKSLVDNVVTDERQAMLVRGIVMLAKSLGLKTVAEGIEDEAQAQKLRDLGCTLFQGYYFGKPNPIEHWADQDWSEAASAAAPVSLNAEAAG